MVRHPAALGTAALLLAALHVDAREQPPLEEPETDPCGALSPGSVGLI